MILVLHLSPTVRWSIGSAPQNRISASISTDGPAWTLRPLLAAKGHVPCSARVQRRGPAAVTIPMMPQHHKIRLPHAQKSLPLRPLTQSADSTFPAASTRNALPTTCPPNQTLVPVPVTKAKTGYAQLTSSRGRQHSPTARPSRHRPPHIESLEPPASPDEVHAEHRRAINQLSTPDNHKSGSSILRDSKGHLVPSWTRTTSLNRSGTEVVGSKPRRNVVPVRRASMHHGHYQKRTMTGFGFLAMAHRASFLAVSFFSHGAWRPFLLKFSLPLFLSHVILPTKSPRRACLSQDEKSFSCTFERQKEFCFLELF